MPYTRWDMCTGKRERGERWKMERGRERGYRRGGGEDVHILRVVL